MKTEKFILSDEWQQVADASGIVTIQNISGNCRMYVGDSAPTGDDVYFRLADGAQPVTLGDTVNAWVKGSGVLAVITV